jgi:hypothetical protein
MIARKTHAASERDSLLTRGEFNERRTAKRKYRFQANGVIQRETVSSRISELHLDAELNGVIGRVVVEAFKQSKPDTEARTFSFLDGVSR